MANPFPFVAGSILEAEQLNGIGEYVDYTPTYTNFTLGNGTATFRYGRVQDFIHVHGKIVLGSTSAMTGAMFMTLPFATTAQVVNSPLGFVRLTDSGTGSLVGVVSTVSSSLFAPNVLNASATYLTQTAFSATVPFVWAVNDEIIVNFVYEV